MAYVIEVAPGYHPEGADSDKQIHIRGPKRFLPPLPGYLLRFHHLMVCIVLHFEYTLIDLLVWGKSIIILFALFFHPRGTSM